MKTTRRGFLLGCSTAMAALAGSRLPFLGFAQGATASTNRETVVVVFLRGGMDGLSLIPPVDGDDRGFYEEARPFLRIPTTGQGAALPLSAQFGLHPSAAPLQSLFQAGKLAVIHAVGSSGRRSHFDAQKYLELGTPGVKTTPEGWLARHLGSAPPLLKPAVFPALATGAIPPTSLQGSTDVVSLTGPTAFKLGYIGHTSWASGEQWSTLRRLYSGGDTLVHTAGLHALNAAGLIESYVRTDYEPSSGAAYPAGVFGDQLKMIAQLIKADAGLRVATIDLGGWDTHDNQGNTTGGVFSGLVQQLATGMAAFYGDLDGNAADAPTKRLTVVVLSEFGRRVRENANRGTDHGTANPVLILGGNVVGGFHGTWPGLHPDQRFDNADLAPTTDLRRVLSEILIRRAANPRLGEVFPGYADYTPLNITSGSDLVPDYTAAIPTTPGNFAVARMGSTTLRLTWTSAAFATNYRIERRDSQTSDWVHLAALGREAEHYDDTTAPQGSNPAYRLQAYNSHGESSFVEAAAATESDPRAQWRLQYFGTASNSGAAADNAIATNDGLSNFAKYALGLNPLVPTLETTTGYVPGRPRTEVGPGTISLVFVRPVDRSDVRYDVETSEDLQTWSVVDSVLEGTADGMERRRATVTVTSAQPDARFIKLSVRPR